MTESYVKFMALAGIVMQNTGKVNCVISSFKRG